jgi:uncharacterized membrane protein YdbT with pleckstrin-like domain
MDLEPGEVVIFEGHPSWRSALGFYLKGLVPAVVVAAILVLADVTTTALGILIGIAIFAVVLVVGYLKRLFTVYLISNQRLYIRKGFIARDEQQTHIDRVQNVNTTQSVLQRVLVIGTVDFDTAGNDDADFRFAGVASPRRVVDAVHRAQRDTIAPGV